MGDGGAMKPASPTSLPALPIGEIGERPCDGVFIAKLVTHHYQARGCGDEPRLSLSETASSHLPYHGPETVARWLHASVCVRGSRPSAVSECM